MFFEALSLTLLGMGVVFCFLLLLILGVVVMSRVIQRFFPEQEAVSEQELAAVAVAVISKNRRVL